MSVRPAGSTRLLLPGFAIVGIGVIVALATDIALTVFTPAKFAFAVGGLVLLIPTMVVKDPKSYWLFLFVFSIPFHISKWLTASLVDTGTLVDTYGMPASGTITVELYLTDVVLVAMLVPWLARVCLRKERLYFPKIGYLFVLYLAWSLLISLINAQSLYLSMIELCRQALYFLSFVYLVNNVATRLQFRSVVWAVFLGLIIGAGTVIIFFERGIGTENFAFASLHDQQATSANSSRPGAKAPDLENLTVDGTTRRFGTLGAGQGSDIKRSQGMFRHPGVAAGLCGLTLPIVLAYIVTARTNRHRILFFTVYAWGLIALFLTFSRAGLIGLMVGTLAFFTVAGWSGLMSRRLLKLGAVILSVAAALSIPLLLVYFGTRPGSFLMRFYLFETALRGYWQHPILGVGLNNGTAAMKAGRQALIEIGIPMPPTESADSLYLTVLTEVGPVGFVLYFVFFVKVMMIALRAIREVAIDLKPLLVGMVAGLASLATQNIADDTLAGHSISGLLWLFAALIVTIARCVHAETRFSSAGGDTVPGGPLICGPAS